MIVNYNVCDHCGTQKQIMSGSTEGVDIGFNLKTPYSSIENPGKYRQINYQGTFCDKECLLSYLKENLNDQGFFKVKK